MAPSAGGFIELRLRLCEKQKVIKYIFNIIEYGTCWDCDEIYLIIMILIRSES